MCYACRGEQPNAQEDAELDALVAELGPNTGKIAGGKVAKLTKAQEDLAAGEYVVVTGESLEDVRSGARIGVKVLAFEPKNPEQMLMGLLVNFTHVLNEDGLEQVSDDEAREAKETLKAKSL